MPPCTVTIGVPVLALRGNARRITFREFTDWCSVQTRDRSPRAARSTRISSKCRKRRGRHLQPPRRWRRYLARLRFHLELTVPGVSGGQILPHNDGSHRALACASGSRNSGMNREEERKEKDRLAPSVCEPLARSRKALPNVGRDCTRHDTVFRDPDERGEQSGCQRGKGKVTRARVGGSDREPSRRLARVMQANRLEKPCGNQRGKSDG